MNEPDTGWTRDEVAAAAYDAWLGLYTDNPVTTPETRAGIPGQIWKGDIDRAIRDACDLPPGHPAPIRRIIEELRRAGNLVPLDSDPAGGAETIVWIPDVWQSGPIGPDGSGEPDILATLPATPSATGQTVPGSSGVASVPPASPDRRRGTRVTTFSCPHCAFVGLTEQALRTHEMRLENRPHPAGRYPCPMCPAVYTHEPAASAHARRDHRVLGVICWPCSRPFPDRSSWSRHRRTEHPREDTGPMASSRAADAPVSAKPISVAHENSTELRATLKDVLLAIRAVTKLLEEPPYINV